MSGLFKSKAPPLPPAPTPLAPMPEPVQADESKLKASSKRRMAKKYGGRGRAGTMLGGAVMTPLGGSSSGVMTR